MMMRPPLTLLRDPGHFLALGFGSGYAPRAPGTAGTLTAIPLWWLMSLLPAWAYGILLLLISILGVWLCGRTARALGTHDHPAIVWDEFAGLLLSLWLAPAGWIWVVLGFGLFRLFDIVKPWPIRVLDRQVKGGLGIMADDLLAGLFAWLCLQAIAWGVAYAA